jgi:hypothetical protein
MSDDIFDFFKKQKHHQKNQHGPGYYERSDHHRDDHHGDYRDDHHGKRVERYGEYAGDGYGRHDSLQKILAQVLNNPKILIAGGIALLVILILGVFLLIALMPVVTALLGGVSKMGLKGIIETLWFGAGNR